MLRVSAPLIRTLDGGLATPISAAPRPEHCEACHWQRVYPSDIESDDPELSVLAYCEHPCIERHRIGWPREHIFPEWCPMGYGREERRGSRT